MKNHFPTVPSFSDTRDLLPKRLHPPEQLFVEQSGEEPHRGIVQTDDAVNVPACLTVIPGAHITFFQQTSGDEFRKENGTGVDAPPKQRPFFSNPTGDGGQKSGHPIDGEHPDGGLAYELHLPPLKGFEARPEDFQAPANKSAEDKFVFHVGSIPKNRREILLK